MFTGIIEETGTITSISKIGTLQLELSVSCQLIQDEMKLGDSVAVNGVCLTVVRFDPGSVTFEISSETVSHTTFSRQPTGTKVNLERALRLSDRLGGHIVQGHVDCMSSINTIKKSGGFFDIEFSLPKSILRYVVKKGSIAIDGISLTIADLSDNGFRVSVIPHTYQQTILCHKKPGDSVHIETDILARYIERFLINDSDESMESLGITEEFLKNHGF